MVPSDRLWGKFCNKFLSSGGGGLLGGGMGGFFVSALGSKFGVNKGSVIRNFVDISGGGIGVADLRQKM